MTARHCACIKDKSDDHQGTVSTQREDSGWLPDTVHSLWVGVVATRTLCACCRDSSGGNQGTEQVPGKGVVAARHCIHCGEEWWLPEHCGRAVDTVVVATRALSMYCGKE